MSESVIHHTHGEIKGRFYIGESTKHAAEMTYSIASDTLIIIDHTEVSDDHRGEGLGRKLVDFAVDWAREKGIKILPLCPFAKAQFDKDESIRDVLK